MSQSAPTFVAQTHEASWLYFQRTRAARRFAEQGLPSPRAEEWRFTRLADLNPTRYAPAPCPADWPATAGDLLEDAWRLVFVDGYFCAGLSLLPDDADIAAPLARAIQTQPARVEPCFGHALTDEDHGFIHINTWRFTDGAFLRVPSGVRLDRPLQIVHIGRTRDSLAATRHLIVLEHGAEAEIVETFLGEDNSRLGVSVMEILMETQSRLTLSRQQTESRHAWHFGGVYVRQARDSVLHHHNMALGGLLARSEIHVHMEEGADCALNGLFIAQGNTHLDQHIRISHTQPRATSRVTYRGIAAHHARGVFQGRVVVEKNAARSDAAMSCRNLLLSDSAEIDAKPQLEIYNDDVKCAHGVTVGQLDEDAVFFLRSRGLAESEARCMLTLAFAHEMLERQPILGLRALGEAHIDACLLTLDDAS